jgi:HK97 family phage prohead protease
MDKEIKSFDLSIKEDGEEKGSVEAVFSVYNNVDSDGDVVVRGAVKSGFANNQVPMVFAHKWDQPIGKGVIEEKEDSAVFKGSFFMDTEAGKEAYNLVKSMGDLQQWSFGFRVNDSEVGKVQKDDSETQARFLKDLTVYEVSPVLVGANQETYTLAIKSGEDTIYEKNEEKEPVAFMDDHFTTEDEAMARAKELGCDGIHSVDRNGTTYYMPCKTHEDYEKMSAGKDADVEVENTEESSCNCDSKKDAVVTEEKYGSCDYGDSGKCAKDKEKDLEVSQNDSSVSGKRFSDEVKDVLAALDDLISRTKAIGILREKDGRKLSKEATTALRAVQDDLNDAWEELDEVISQVGKVPEVTDEIEAMEEEAPVTEEEATEVVSEEVSEEITEDVEIEEAEVEVEVAEEEEVSEDATEEEVDDSIDEVILQAQVQMTESLIAEQEIDE